MEERTQNTAPVLTIRNLSKHLGSRLILDNINLDVYPGEIFGFLGPNGSGKTTTIKLMLGLLRMEQGEIRICGRNIVTDFEEAVKSVGGIIENPEMYKYLTGRQNLEQYARMYGNIPKERFDEVIRLVGLQTRIDDKISKYSLGMRQRLGLAQAILHRPALLVLDEPTNGLDPAGIKDLRDILKELCHREGVAVFVSSHLLAELEQMCDRVGVIDRGRMLGTHSMAELQNTYADGKELLSLSVGNAPAVAEELRADYPDGRLDDSDDTIRLLIERAKVPDLVRRLAGEGVDIYEVHVMKKTLETAFLEIVGNTGSHEVGTGGFTPAPQSTQGQDSTDDNLSGNSRQSGEEDTL